MEGSNRAPQCVLGNGECPLTCELFANSAAITDALGDDFDPEDSRRNVIFADAQYGVDVTQIAIVLAHCELEPLRGQQNNEVE